MFSEAAKVPQGEAYKLLAKYRYEVTFVNTENMTKITCQNVYPKPKAFGKSQGISDSGIGHSVIRGLVTTGQWSSASSTARFRGSQMCHQEFVVDS